MAKEVYIFLTIVKESNEDVKISTIEITLEDRDRLLSSGLIKLDRKRELSLTSFEYYDLIL